MAQHSTISVLLADDAPVMRKAIRGLLEEEPTISIVGEAETFKLTVRAALVHKPDVILLDLHMPGSEVLEPTTLTHGLSTCGSRILAMTLLGENEGADRELAKSFGAETLLDKSKLFEELIPAILDKKR